MSEMGNEAARFASTPTQPADSEWMRLSGGAHQILLCESDRMLVLAHASASVWIQNAEQRQLISAGDSVFLRRGLQLHIDVEQSAQLFLVNLPLSDRGFEPVEIIADSILKSCADIFLANNFPFGSLAQSNNFPIDAPMHRAWESLVIARVELIQADATPQLRNKNIVAKLDAFIDNRLAHPLSVDDFSAHLKMPKIQVWRWMKNNLDCTPWQYLIKRRLAHAKRLLSHSKYSIVDIALQTGFGSQAHFTNAFKANHAVTPGSYRRRDSAPISAMRA
jgi:AraC-like DNA-binding protein